MNDERRGLTKQKRLYCLHWPEDDLIFLRTDRHVVETKAISLKQPAFLNDKNNDERTVMQDD